MAVKLILALLIAVLPTMAGAAPLLVKPGESWVFRVAKNEPVGARRVAATAKPAKGEIMVTVRAFLGTALTAVNATGRGWSFKAELMSGGKASPARSCTLPKSTDPILEQWPGKTADAVRLSRFVPADGGTC
jgi:hypothetical protein